MRHLKFVGAMIMVIIAAEILGPGMLGGKLQVAQQLGIPHGQAINRGSAEVAGHGSNPGNPGNGSGADHSTGGQSAALPNADDIVLLNPGMMAAVSPSGMVIASIIDGDGELRIQQLQDELNGVATAEAPLPTFLPVFTPAASAPGPGSPTNVAVATLVETPTTILLPTPEPSRSTVQRILVPTAGYVPVLQPSPTLPPTPKVEATETPTWAIIATKTPIASATLLPSTPPSLTPEATATDSIVPTWTPTGVWSSTPTSEPTLPPTYTGTATATASLTPSGTPTPTATSPSPSTPTPTASYTFTAEPTSTPTPTVTPEAPTVTPTGNGTVPQPTLTTTIEPLPTATKELVPTDTATESPTATETETLTSTPTDTETVTPTAPETATATDANTPTPTETATETPTLTPTATPVCAPGVSKGLSTAQIINSWVCLDQNMKFRFKVTHSCYGGTSQGLVTWNKDTGITGVVNESSGSVSGLMAWTATVLRMKTSGCNDVSYTFNMADNTITPNRAPGRSLLLTVIEVLP